MELAQQGFRRKSCQPLFPARSQSFVIVASVMLVTFGFGEIILHSKTAGRLAVSQLALRQTFEFAFACSFCASAQSGSTPRASDAS